MKRFSIIQMAVILVLMVTVVSCGIQRSITDEYYDVEPRGNVYYGSPFYGNRTPIIVERDPFTGRYYQVSPYGGYSTISPYDNRYNNNRRRYYNNQNRNYNNNRYNDRYNNNRSYRQDNSVRSQNNAQQNQENRQKSEDVRSKVLGERKD